MMPANLLPAIDPTATLAEPIYKELARHPGYRIGSDGTVWSCWRSRGRGTTYYQSKIWKPLSDKPKRNGYRIVSLRGCMCHVHHLVLEAFIGPRPPGLQACHNDGNKLNNAVTNLRWDTCKANAADRVRHGTALVGERSPNVKLTESDVREIRALHRALKLPSGRVPPGTNCELAKRFGVAVGTIKSIAVGERWKGVA